MMLGLHVLFSLCVEYFKLLLIVCFLAGLVVVLFVVLNCYSSYWFSICLIPPTVLARWGSHLVSEGMLLDRRISHVKKCLRRKHM